MPVIAYIGLGSNLGDRIATCRQALKLLARAGHVAAISSFYNTEPVGYEKQEDFVNAVAALETKLSPEALLAACREIEDELGRKRDLRWGPRTIDLDILLYGEERIETQDLIIPHPLMHLRRFVLVPLCEIAPSARHPALQRTAVALLRELGDPHRVVKCGEA